MKFVEADEGKKKKKESSLRIALDRTIGGELNLLFY